MLISKDFIPFPDCDAINLETVNVKWATHEILEN